MSSGLGLGLVTSGLGLGLGLVTSGLGLGLVTSGLVSIPASYTGVTSYSPPVAFSSPISAQAGRYSHALQPNIGLGPYDHSILYCQVKKRRLIA